jgi:hypothetical protein
MKFANFITDLKDCFEKRIPEGPAGKRLPGEVFLHPLNQRSLQRFQGGPATAGASGRSWYCPHNAGFLGTKEAMDCRHINISTSILRECLEDQLMGSKVEISAGSP